MLSATQGLHNLTFSSSVFCVVLSPVCTFSCPICGISNNSSKPNMSSKQLRLHVGNLPENVTQDDLVKKFAKFGRVDCVNIKHKREAGGNKILSTFSFVDLETDDGKLTKCLKQLNGLEWGKHFLTVGLAKESFLQRLQKEREAAQSYKAAGPVHDLSVGHSLKIVPESVASHGPKSFLPKTVNSSVANENDQSRYRFKQKQHQDPILNIGVPGFKSKNKLVEVGDIKRDGVISDKRKQERNSSSSNKLAVGSIDVLKKLESFSNVWKDPGDSEEDQSFPYDLSQSESEEEEDGNNGIAPQRNVKFTEEPSKGTFQREPSTISAPNQAEERRIKSLAERQKTFEQQKKAVKLALSDGKVPLMNKKVIFSDDDDDNDKDVHASSKSSEAPASRGKKFLHSKELTLFDESDNESNHENWENNFELKKQFEGKKGKQLLNLQSRFNNDKRFTLDERFAESDGDMSDSEKSPEDKEVHDGQYNDEMAAEREQQYQILSDILGQPISSTATKINHNSSAKAMVRFDPTKPNHIKYEVSKVVKAADSKRMKRSFDPENVRKTVHRKEVEPEPVSKETFYKVSDSLAEAFKSTNDTQSSAFSLLQMFGPSQVETGDSYKNTEDHSKDKRKEAFSKNVRFSRKFEDFNTEWKEEEEEAGPSKRSRYQDNTKKSKDPFNQKIVKQESFFFQPDDSRLKEGADFFIKTEEPLNFLAFKRKRRELRHLVNRKIQRNAIRATAFKTKLGGKSKPRPSRPRVGRRRGH